MCLNCSLDITDFSYGSIIYQIIIYLLTMVKARNKQTQNALPPLARFPNLAGANVSLIIPSTIKDTSRNFFEVEFIHKSPLLQQQKSRFYRKKENEFLHITFNFQNTVCHWFCRNIGFCYCSIQLLNTSLIVCLSIGDLAFTHSPNVRIIHS